MRAIAQTDRILKMFNDGYAIVTISQTLGIFRRNVKRVLEANGINPSKPKQNYKQDRKNTKRWYARQNEDFLKQFDDAELLAAVIKVFKKDWNYDLEQYRQFILKFYNDTTFRFSHSSFLKTGDGFFAPNIDHIIPKSKGGTNDLDNLQCLTRFENMAKHDANEEQWSHRKQNILNGVYFK